jgi:uncharacterized protein YpuA (DUF1002 family)
MLENSIWKQYNKKNDFREKLAEFCVLDIQDLIEDDKELYGVMKSKLTKKELKLFAMDSANVSDDDIKADFNVDDDSLEKMKFKLYKKFKQDKTRLCFRQAKEFD